MSDDHGGPAVTLADRVRRLETLLEERGVVQPNEAEKALKMFLGRSSPSNGARIVARAWSDEDFRRRLLADANRVLPELGLDMGGGTHETRLKVVENTVGSHNVIVCTLCSCYPLHLLGPSPGWYRSESYRARVVREPHRVLAELGLELPDEVAITVWDSSAESRYMVLPKRPAGTESASEEALMQLVTRDGLIGAAEV